ncbi:hypothetical protein RRG08_054185 [Elysia crispata]|uniref:Myelin regulatory factor n=1 Tax=Elysia crispata TaxID=231223 RepID=A0AAE1A2V4_9GAST|nr:hypothetical protein RRG08_054185 [Elysia crispata]
MIRSLHDDAFPLGLTQIPLENGVSSDGNYDFPIQSSSSTSPGDRSTSSSESDTAPRTGYDPTGQGQMIHSHGVLGGPHLEHMSQQEKFQLQQTLPQQQQQQPQHQQQRRHLSLTDCQQNHQSGCMHQQHYPQHHHRHHPHHNQQQHETYFSQSGQPEIEYDSYEQSAIGQPSFPDSPPNSNEPLSPTETLQHQQTMTDLKSTIPGSLQTISQPVFFMGPHGRLGGPGGALPSGKVPQPYSLGADIGGKLHHQTHLMHHQHQQQQQQQHQHLHSHHHPHHHPQQQGPTPAQIHQHEQQQQQHRVPMPHYPTGVAGFPPSMPGAGQHIPNQISPPLSTMGSMNNLAGQGSKKRKYSGSPPGTLSAGLMPSVNSVLNIKQEPHGPQFGGFMPDGMSNTSLNDAESPAYEIDANGMYIDNTYRVIKWQPFSKPQWVELLDDTVKNVLMTPEYRVDADKGFNFSAPDDAFVCQKKNHFQITVHIRLYGNAKYLRTQEGAIKKIEYFSLDFYGVKMESQSQKIKIEQSLSDRSKRLFYPVKVDIIPDKETKKTEGRLHFSETTSNNMRKKNMPNPDQRFFLLVVSLNAHSGDKDFVVVDSVSEKIIVRASNPGQFDNNSEVLWLKGQTPESVYHRGRVGINTERPDEALTVHGNLRVTGMLTQPSDMRAKEKIQEIDPKHQLKNVSKLKLYKFSYNEQYAASAGIPEENRQDTGVLAQEIMEILPDAVQETGDFVLSNGETIENFLVLNKDRLFMENVGAVKELAKLTDNLNSRIQELEKMNKRLGKLKRYGSLKSNISWVSELSCSTLSTVSSIYQNCAEESQSAKEMKRNQTFKQEKTEKMQKTRKKEDLSTGSHHHTSESTGRSQRGSSSRHTITSTPSTTNSSGNISTDSGNNSISTKRSFISWFKAPISQTTKSLFKNRCAPVIVIMTFCLVAAVTLYVMEKTRTDNHSHPSGVLQGESNGNRQNNGSFNPNGGTTLPHRGSNTATPILPHPRTSQEHHRITTVSPTTSTQSGTHSSTRPMVPPWPVCHANSCEKLCCPPQYEDQQPVVVPGGGYNAGGGSNINYNIGHNVNYNIKQKNAGQGESKAKDGTNFHIPSGDDVPISSIDIKSLPKDQDDAYPNYNVVYQPRPSLGFTNRKKRSADTDFARPHIRIAELNFTLDDEFCLVDKCGNNSYSYFVYLHPFFGFDNVTLELSTPTATSIAMCSQKLSMPCFAISQSSESGRNTFHQETVARWPVMIGTHYNTDINFRVVYRVNGAFLPMSDVCDVTTNEDYLVINYNIEFQRSCTF